MRNLRVLQFITPNGFYGAERWILALANNLNRVEVTVDLAVTSEYAGQDLTVAELYPKEAGQVHYCAMGSRFDWRVVSRLAKLVRERQIDIIHTHGYKSDIIGLLAARRAGVSCVSSPHGYPTKAGFKMSLFINAGLMALRRFDAVAPLSEDLVRDMRHFRVPEYKVQFIENGVDLTELTPYRKPLSVPIEAGRTFQFGYVGQMIPRKGISDMLRAFDWVWQQDSAASLTLVGDGSQRAELEALAKTLPSAQNIHFLGFRSDRLELVKNFDAFLMTSALEGIPRCLMEAMAIGTPVVAYDIPGVDQLIEDRVTGLLCEHGNWKSLAETCIHLKANPEVGGRMAVAARELVDTRFSAERMALQYEDLYRGLLGQSRGPAEAMQLNKSS